MATPAALRSAVAHVRANHGVSERRACLVLEADRSSIRYRSRRPDDSEIRERLRELSRQRCRFGYRRLHLLLAREGYAMNQKKLRRLYAEEKLQVRRRGGRKRALDTRAPMAIPQGTNQRWSLNFVADAFSDGRRFRCLNETLFASLPHARRVLADWKDDYNHMRPHSGLGDLTPACYQRPLRASKPHGTPPITGGNFGLRSKAPQS